MKSNYLNTVRVEPDPDHPGSSGSDPGLGYFDIPIPIYFKVLKIFHFSPKYS